MTYCIPPPPVRATLWAIAALVLLIVSLCTLTGCFSSERQAQTVTERQETRVGLDAGQPTQLTVTTRERSIEADKSTAGVDVQAAISAAVAGVRGDLLGALDKMKPQPVDLSPVLSAVQSSRVDLSPITGELAKLSADKPEKTDWTTLIGAGAAALTAGGYGVMKHREARRTQADADEAWDAHARSLAALPPEQAQAILDSKKA